MLTINQKIAIFGIITASLMSILAPIVVYEFKIYSCTTALLLERQKNSTTEAWSEGRCHAIVNGAEGV